MSNIPKVNTENPAASLPSLLTVDQTANTLAISRATVYKLFKTGELPCLKIGNSTRVSQHGLTQYINSLERQAKERSALRVKGQL